MQNPFKPTAGATPPDLIGRAGLLDEFEYGLHQGSGAPGLLTIITGARGIGKTVMLSAAEEIARNHGWAVMRQHRQQPHSAAADALAAASVKQRGVTSRR